MEQLRAKSQQLTAYLELLIDALLERLAVELGVPASNGNQVNGSKDANNKSTGGHQMGWLVTPRDPDARGAQLSFKLNARFSARRTLKELERRAVVV